MGIGFRTDVVELDNVAALEATLNGALTGDLSIVVSDNCRIYRCYIKLTVNQLTMWESTG